MCIFVLLYVPTCSLNKLSITEQMIKLCVPFDMVIGIQVHDERRHCRAPIKALRQTKLGHNWTQDVLL